MRSESACLAPALREYLYLHGDLPGQEGGICSERVTFGTPEGSANVVTAKTNLTRDSTIRLVVDAREFYCPTQ